MVGSNGPVPASPPLTADASHAAIRLRVFRADGNPGSTRASDHGRIGIRTAQQAPAASDDDTAGAPCVQQRYVTSPLPRLQISGKIIQRPQQGRTASLVEPSLHQSISGGLIRHDDVAVRHGHR